MQCKKCKAVIADGSDCRYCGKPNGEKQLGYLDLIFKTILVLLMSAVFLLFALFVLFNAIMWAMGLYIAENGI